MPVLISMARTYLAIKFKFDCRGYLGEKRGFRFVRGGIVATLSEFRQHEKPFLL